MKKLLIAFLLAVLFLLCACSVQSGGDKSSETDKSPTQSGVSSCESTADKNGEKTTGENKTTVSDGDEGTSSGQSHNEKYNDNLSNNGDSDNKGKSLFADSDDASGDKTVSGKDTSSDKTASSKNEGNFSSSNTDSNIREDSSANNAYGFFDE